MTVVSAIFAMDSHGGIGKDGKLPWSIPDDLAWFKKHTRSKPVIMGRKTYESIGRPLPNRLNIVLTTNPANIDVPDSVVVKPSLMHALEHCRTYPEKMIIGGSEVFRNAWSYLDSIYMTEVYGNYDCDTFMPPEYLRVQDVWNNPVIMPAEVQNGHTYQFTYLTRPGK